MEARQHQALKAQAGRNSAQIKRAEQIKGNAKIAGGQAEIDAYLARVNSSSETKLIG